MGQEKSDIGHGTEISKIQARGKDTRSDDFVLEKTIFNNIFEKDIRRVFIYKKAERLARAIHLIIPAFAESVSLKNRIDALAVGIVDAALLPPAIMRAMLSRELLALSSMLSIVRTSGLLSSMNAEIITQEAHILLQEVALYEEPRLSLDEAPTLSALAKRALSQEVSSFKHPALSRSTERTLLDKRHIKDTEQIKDRREAILSVIKNKQKANIKDISTIIRGVSEKTIQRELSALIGSGAVLKEGERRWSTYSLTSG